MKFFKALIISIFLFVVISCSNGPRKERGERFENYDAIIMLYLSRIVNEYKKVISLFKDEKNIYDEILKLYYEINAIHDDIIKKEKADSQVFEKLQAQVTALEELVKVDWPQEIHQKLQAIKRDVESIQKFLDEVDALQMQEETEPTEEPSEPMQEETEPAEEPSESMQEETEPAEEPSESMQEETEPAEEPSESMQEETEPAEEPFVQEQEESETTKPSEKVIIVVE